MLSDGFLLLCTGPCTAKHSWACLLGVEVLHLPWWSLGCRVVLAWLGLHLLGWGLVLQRGSLVVGGYRLMLHWRVLGLCRWAGVLQRGLLMLHRRALELYGRVLLLSWRRLTREGLHYLEESGFRPISG